MWKYQANIEVGNGKGRALIWGKRVMVGKDSTLLQPTPIARLDQIIWRQEWHLRRLGFYYAAFEMSNLLIARTFYPFQKCCADAIFVPHYFEISIFHMKRPKIKTQSLVYLATAEICIMVGSSSPLEESFSARPDGWILATLVFGLLFCLTLPVHPCEICFTWVNGH